MKNESISLDELSQRASDRRQCCQEVESLCQRQCACVFTLTTALLLQGIEVPSIDVRKHPRLGEGVLQVAVGPDEYKPRDHVRGNRRKRAKPKGLPYAFFASGVPLDTVEVAPGVTCTTPLFTWFLFATRLSLEELVVLGDSLLRRNVLHERYTLQDFEDMLVHIEHYAHNPRNGRARAPRGITACRKALVLMQEHTDSSTETRLRLMLERHGLPRPTVNHMVQLPDGGVVFMDIAFVKAQVDVEYDGKHHEQQWEADAQRRLRIESAGWDYVQVVNGSMHSENGQRMVAEVVARHIEDRTGVNYLRTTPFTLEQLADRRRSLWKTAP